MTSSARNGIFFIPLILLMPRLFGLRGVEYTQAVADVLSLGLSIPLVLTELSQMKD